MINTHYTHVRYEYMMYTVQYKYEYSTLYTVQYRVYHYFWARFNFIWGGLHTVQYRVYHYFLLGSILLGGGGLSPPSPNDGSPMHEIALFKPSFSLRKPKLIIVPSIKTSLYRNSRFYRILVQWNNRLSSNI